MEKIVNVIGAGLAGSEASLFLANHGIKVNLYERRPKVEDGAHHTSNFGELVCSNSLKSKKIDNACGLLKEEIKCLGSIMMEASEVSAVPSGDSLSVDRNKFSEYITNKIKSNPNINIIYEEINEPLEGITLICTGPLTSESLLKNLSKLTSEEIYGFYDASAPIIYKDSIDFSKVFIKGRYDQEDGNYINLGMDKEEYLNFYNVLINAKKALLHDFDKKDFFEGCMPIEVLASRGVDTMRFGPLKPVGLENNGKTYYAVAQLRQDDLIGEFYNLVGFQTNLTYPEQKRVFSMLPGLQNARFARYGLMHRNSYLYAPKILNEDLSLKTNKDVYVGGQLSGVEGYVESAASGLLAAIYIYLRLNNKEFKPLSYKTCLGSLIRYITHTGSSNFAPMNANYGIIYKANKEDKLLVASRSLKEIEEFKKYIDE